jgi:hypothetical protein
MSESQSTTAQGNRFRDRVAQLLHAAHFDGVTTERRIGGKKLDIYFEERTLTETRRIAVECKDYGRPLTAEQIRKEIYLDYHALIEARLLDGVLIVAPWALNADADAFVRTATGFAFKTFAQLQNDVMNFGSYLQSMRAQFHEQGLDTYYVAAKLSDGRDLEEMVAAWLDEPTARPIAILAGYGMGKTSFARRIATEAAVAHSSDGQRRIPILIRLGEISDEQALEGLLGKVFTATHVVMNYSFELFMALNQAGRFLIILDGFDEMKHTMSWSQFKYNFGQLHRLVVPNSKIILLGRPSAFLSDAEHLHALRGIRRIMGKDIREPNWPEYEEVRLAEFTAETAYAFIASYMQYTIRTARATGAATIDDASVADRLSQIRAIGYEDLIGRPVQARMLAEIATDPAVPLVAFSRFELYQVFITRIIEREQLKRVRQSISDEKRRLFIRKIAWWLWTTASSTGFSADSLPNSFVKPFGSDDNEDPDALKRELLSGSMLERKSNNTFYFAHRSFQEFLVAEHMISTSWTPSEIHLVSHGLTPEIARFLEESDSSDSIASWAELLGQPKAPIKLSFLALVAHAADARNEGWWEEPVTSVNPLIAVVQVISCNQRQGPARAFDCAIELFRSTDERIVKAAALMGAFVAMTFWKSSDERASAYARLCALVLADAIEELEALLKAGHKRGIASDTLSESAQIVAASFTRGVDIARDHSVEFDVSISNMLDMVQRSLRPSYILEDFDIDPVPIVQLRTNALGQYESGLAMSKAGPTVARFFREHPEPSKSIVRVKSKTTGATAPRLPKWAKD